MTIKWEIPVKTLLTAALFVPHQLVLADSDQQYRSLSKLEQQSACQTLVSQVLPQGSFSCGGSLPLAPTDLVQGGDTPENNQTELLLVERFEPDKSNQLQNSARMADVYSYNYRTDTLNYSVINLTTGQVIRTEDNQEVQLPLTENEVARSINIATENQAVYRLIKDEYQKITGNSLSSMDQLEVKAFIFLAKSMPGQVNEKTKSCGIHRCARLVIHTSNRIALDTAPIIDLSDGLVSQHQVGLL